MLSLGESCSRFSLFFFSLCQHLRRPTFRRRESGRFAQNRFARSASLKLSLGARLRGRTVTQRSKKGSEKVLGRVLGEGSQKGSEKGACYGFYSNKGSEKGSQKGF